MLLIALCTKASEKNTGKIASGFKTRKILTYPPKVTLTPIAVFLGLVLDANPVLAGERLARPQPPLTVASA